jgi:hypothetical protein
LFASVKLRPRRSVSTLIGVLVIGAVAVAAFIAVQILSNAEILSPATVPPVTALCTAQLTTAEDGTISPLFCSDGQLNMRAWDYLAADNLQVMALNRNAGPDKVRAAITEDLRTRASGPRECNAALLAAAYYGWSFHIDPVAGLALDCAIVR